jgi:hypothetical protein
MTQCRVIARDHGSLPRRDLCNAAPPGVCRSTMTVDDVRNSQWSYDADKHSLSRLSDVPLFVERAKRLTEATLHLRVSRGQRRDQIEGPSWDYEGGVQLPGWSASRIEPEEWWTRRAEDWIARRLAQYKHLAEGDCVGWVVTGEQVGRGPDHEPLLVHLTYWARIEADVFGEACALYQRRFDVGSSKVG